MINAVQDTFAIHDLEILSGIKAHTIRIWEKRYGLLRPKRLNRNIREYGILDLQKILNVSLLQKHGYKISEIANQADREIESKAKSISLEEFPSSYYINSLIVSMYSLDEDLFQESYLAQSEMLSFSEIFITTFVPLLGHIGVLWQTNSVRPAQERFISNLIYQKILLNIETAKNVERSSKRVNVLFLPEGEIHEIGLLFMLYHLKMSGERTLYLGRDIPISDLQHINFKFKEINWICAFVIDRTDEEKSMFISQMESLLINTENSCYVVGKMWSSFPKSNQHENMSFYESFDRLVSS